MTNQFTINKCNFDFTVIRITVGCTIKGENGKTVDYSKRSKEFCF
jgi:hypothetical protein